MEPETLTSDAPPPLSKTALKKQQKQRRLEQRKADRKAAEKERRKKDLELKRKEWDEKLAAVSEEEKARLVEARKEARRERMGKRNEEKEAKLARLKRAEEVGQKVVVDLEFADLMAPNEIHSLVQQIMYCYAVNWRCASPAHLCLTGCRGEMQTQLQRIPGYDKWPIQKESSSYIEAFENCKHNLVYLTADADTVLEELDTKKIYIVGGLVDRNRWKGITMKKAQEQGIKSAKLPIGSYLKMSSSQVLTVNQVIEILLKFLETKDWKTAFFQVIPQRKRSEAETEIGMEQVEPAAEVVNVLNDIESEEDEKVVEEEEQDNGTKDKSSTRKRSEAGVEIVVEQVESAAEVDNVHDVKKSEEDEKDVIEEQDQDDDNNDESREQKKKKIKEMTTTN